MYKIILAYLMILVSTYTDFKYKKIFNVITIPLLILGLFLPDYYNIHFRLIFIMVLFIVSFFGVVGGGDIKLLMALTALRGVSFSIYTFFIANLLIAIYLLIRKRKLFIKLIKDLPMQLFHLKDGYFMKSDRGKIILAPFLFLAMIIIDILIKGGVL